MPDDFVHDPRKNPGIKRAYFPLPEETPDDFICVKVQIPEGDEYLELLRTVLKQLTMWYNYARDETHRGKLIADLWRDALFLPELGCNMDCEELTACLQPFFDALTAQLEAMQANVTALVEQAENNAAKPPEEIITEGDEYIYAGALAVVKEMDKDIKKVFTDTEMSFVDNASEALSILLELFPDFAGMTYDEGFELGNAYFENQATAYNADYPAFEVPAACDLMWFIINNGDTFDFNVWGDWAFSIQTVVPDNAAANIYTRYSPLRITFLNQIANLLSPSGSLESYFENLSQVYYAGSQSPLTVPEDCGDHEICGISLTNATPPTTIDITSGTADVTGFIASGDFGGTAWVIASFTESVTNLEKVRFIYDSENIGGAQFYYGESGLITDSDAPVYIGGGLWAWDRDLPAPYTGSDFNVNTRRSISDTTPFRLVRVELCEGI